MRSDLISVLLVVFVAAALLVGLQASGSGTVALGRSSSSAGMGDLRLYEGQAAGAHPVRPQTVGQATNFGDLHRFENTLAERSQSGPAQPTGLGDLRAIEAAQRAAAADQASMGDLHRFESGR